MTSGSGTGVTAPLDKITQLRKAIGTGAPLAMSGVHPPNADRLTPLVTHFLVATCISRDFYTFDETKLQYLAGKAATPTKE
jgi:predicted TIM-barrel enzyme